MEHLSPVEDITKHNYSGKLLIDGDGKAVLKSTSKSRRIRMPDIRRRILPKILRKHFPNVIFNGFKKSATKGYVLGEICDEIVGTIIPWNGEYYLDIPVMTRNPLFKYLFPKQEIVMNYEEELAEQEVELTNQNDIIYFFIMKDAEKFGAELNLSAGQKIASEVILAEQFKEYMKNISCMYSTTTNNKGELEKFFLWDFSGLAYYHSTNSVYDVFESFAHRKCTQCLFGVDLIKFWKTLGRPPVSGMAATRLPVYHINKYGKISKKIAGNIKNISVNDFVEKGWDEIKCKEHILKTLNININFDASMKEVYHSFCMPLLHTIKCIRIPVEKQFVAFTELGEAIMNNTLLREKKVEDPIKKYFKAWREIISYILEGTYKKEGKSVDIHCPTPFEKFIKQAAGYIGYNNEEQLKDWENKQIKPGGEFIDDAGELIPVRSVLSGGKGTLIKNWWTEMYSIVSGVEQTKMDRIERDGSDADKLRKIKELIHSDVSIEYVFENRKVAIDDLCNTISPSGTDEEYETEDGDVKNQKEDKKFSKPEDMFIGEELKKIVIDCFIDEFDEEEWIQFIRKENINILFEDLSRYPPRSKGRLPMATDSNLFINYCRIMHINISDAKIRTKKHGPFAIKMQNITDCLENKLQETGYRG